MEFITTDMIPITVILWNSLTVKNNFSCKLGLKKINFLDFFKKIIIIKIKLIIKTKSLASILTNPSKYK